MGGTASLIATVLSTVTSLSDSGSDNSLAKERAALEEDQRQEEAEDRKRDRAKVVEARELEEKQKRTSLLSQGAASLVDGEPQVAASGLKNKLGE